MNRLVRIILPVLGLLTLGQPVSAQRIASPYRFLNTSQEAGVFITQINPAEGTVGLGSESGPAYGVRYSIQVSGPFMLEGEGMYFPTSHAVLDTAVVDSAYRVIGTADHAIASGTAALRVNLTGQRTWHRVQPFVHFGVGFALEASRDQDAVNLAPESARYEFGTTFAGLLGAGISWVPTERLAVRLDARNLLWKIKTPAGLQTSATGRLMPADEWVQNIGLSAGISFLF
jgi:hypothetical protein